MLHGERACKRTRTPCKAQDILVELHRLSESLLPIEPVPLTMMATLYGSTAEPEPLAEAVAVAVRVVVALPPKRPPKSMGTVNCCCTWMALALVGATQATPRLTRVVRHSSLG